MNGKASSASNHFFNQPIIIDLNMSGNLWEFDAEDDNRVRMTGPAVEVFSGEWPT